MKLKVGLRGYLRFLQPRYISQDMLGLYASACARFAFSGVGVL